MKKISKIKLIEAPKESFLSDSEMSPLTGGFPICAGVYIECSGESGLSNSCTSYYTDQGLACIQIYTW